MILDCPQVPPNVVLVILDAARRDAFEPYGAPGGSSPVVAQLAARGHALADVYSTGCWTVPSHASFFSGLMPRAAGLSRVDSPGAARGAMERLAHRLLPEVLRRAGYRTAACSANLWLSDASGFDLGFDDFRLVDTRRRAEMETSTRRARLRWAIEAVRGSDDGSAAVQTQLETWLGGAGKQPFFWFVNLIECHSPYLPPRGYGDVSLRDRLRGADDMRRHYQLYQIWRTCVSKSFDVPDDALDRLRRLYAGAIRYLDDRLGALLERLDTAGRLDETLVIVTADHGENFGEGGLLAHALSLDDRLIHVPFVAAGPGADRLRLNSLADLPRAIADVAGVAQHPWTDGPPDGVGVAQFDPPADRDDPRIERAVRAWSLDEDEIGRLTTPLACSVRGTLKLVRAGDRELVYDLESDPLEVEPRDAADLPARAEEIGALRAALDHPAMTATASEKPPAPSDEELSDIEARMKLLGYM